MKTLPSSTSSAESADSHSGSKQQELFGQLPSASENHSRKPSSESTGLESPSTTTLEPSQQMSLGESTSYAADSPVSPGVSPGSSEAQKMTAISGRRWLPLLKSYGLNGSLAKMSEALLTNQWASPGRSLTFTASDIKSSLLFCLRLGSERHIDGIESGLLPTAKATDGSKGSRTSAGAERELARGKNIDLGMVAKLWPTPDATPRGATPNFTGKRPSGHKESFNLQTAAKMWPTPTTRDHKGANSDEHLAKARGHLPNAVKMEGHSSGSLNPEWVEWLMGFPAGWTNLTAEELRPELKTASPDSKPSETQSSPRSSSKSDGQSSQRRKSDG